MSDNLHAKTIHTKINSKVIKSNQTPYSKLLEEIANAELSQENYKALHNRRETIISKNELDLFQNAIHLCDTLNAHKQMSIMKNI